MTWCDLWWEELQPDDSDCVLCELLDSAASVGVLWEVPDSVHPVPDPDPLSTGMALPLHPYLVLTRGGGWLRQFP